MGDFSAYRQSRTTIVAINTWVAVVIPTGARNALIMLEDSTAVMRVSQDNAIAAASQGAVVAAGGNYTFEGAAVDSVTVYVASDKATVAVCQYTTA